MMQAMHATEKHTNHTNHTTLLEEGMEGEGKDDLSHLEDHAGHGLSLAVGPILEHGSDYELNGEAGLDLDEKPWSRSMEVRCTEVEFMLKNPVTNDDDLNYTLAAAEAGLLFMEQLEAKVMHLP